MTYTVGIIGTGEDPDDPGSDGYAMAYRHAPGYTRLDSCRLLACADIVRENAEAFAQTHGIREEHVYEDFRSMVEGARPDIISICTPPRTHAELTIGCARMEGVKAIHCEKPMAADWAESKRMVDVCDGEDVQLTINHQLRFGQHVRKAKRLVDEGEIGALERLEFGTEHLYDSGTHLFDLCNYFVGESDPEWVMGQIEYSQENLWFGMHNENQALVHWTYEDGTQGLGATGWGSGLVDGFLRLRGTDGEIRLGSSDEAVLQLRRDGEEWRRIPTDGDGLYRPEEGLVRAAAQKMTRKVSSSLADRVTRASYTERAIADIVEALDGDGDSELRGEIALAADELIYAGWESARRRGRVELPLSIGDNPLESMVENGDLALGVSESL